MDKAKGIYKSIDTTQLIVKAVPITVKLIYLFYSIRWTMIAW